MRLFVAIPIPEDLSTRFSSFASRVRGARWVRPEGMHITLFFVGEADREHASDLDDELSQISIPAFDLRSDRFGYFDRGNKIKSIWAGVENSDALLYQHSRVEAAAVRASFAREERKYKPRITLARLNHARAEDVGQWIALHDAMEPGLIHVTHFMLYQSHLAREGSIYEPLIEYSLTQQA